MARITQVEVSIEDKVYCGSYESVQPGIRLTATLEDGEEPEDAVAALQAVAGELWERALCQRLWTKIEQHQTLQGPPLDPWAIRLYNTLTAKIYGDVQG